MLPEYPANPEGRALVAEMKGRINDVFEEFGATHMQLGKAYPYMRDREQNNGELLRIIKQQLDPDGLMNPGRSGAVSGDGLTGKMAFVSATLRAACAHDS